ncbi:MAG: hypothetical protein NT001_00140 [Candidatus Woesearchaeota archaeon]|nr:hypothetical protein [Candidatus Woesearchaeota archaeon]
MKNRLFDSKKALAWSDIKEAVLTLVLIAILVGIVIMAVMIFKKGIGCEGVVTGLLGKGEFKCMKTCSGGSVDASNVAFWSIFSESSGDRTCCKGGSISAGAGKTGDITITKDGAEVSEEITLTKGEDAKFILKGTGDIKKCSVDLIMPLKDGKTASKSIKDKAACQELTFILSKIGTEANADITKEYIMNIVRYNSNEDQISSMSIKAKVNAAGGADTGTSTGAGQEAAAQTISFDMYTDMSEKITKNSQYTSTSGIPTQFVDYVVKYAGAWKMIVNEEKTGKESTIYDTDPAVNPSKTEENVKGGTYELLTNGVYTFTLMYREGADWKLYGDKYIINIG